jgi:hypothetical protein
MEKILLPKKYLSWSQMQIWKSSKERYKREYFSDAKKLDTDALRFGKGFANSVEDGTYKETVPSLQVYSEIEQKVEIEINGVPILSYIDSYCPEKNVFHEYKTGKIPWTSSKVHSHDQLVFYATALNSLRGEMPEYCDLHWIETKPIEKKKDTGGFHDREIYQLEFTGREPVVFRRNFDYREVERMEREIHQVAMEISEAYLEYLQNELL